MQPFAYMYRPAQHLNSELMQLHAKPCVLSVLSSNRTSVSMCIFYTLCENYCCCTTKLYCVLYYIEACLVYYGRQMTQVLYLQQIALYSMRAGKSLSGMCDTPLMLSSVDRVSAYSCDLVECLIFEKCKHYAQSLHITEGLTGWKIGEVDTQFQFGSKGFSSSVISSAYRY